MIKSLIVPSLAGSAKTSSTEDTSLAIIASNIVSTNDINSAFLATKSVSELTSTIAATLPLILTEAKPSAAILSAF